MSAPKMVHNAPYCDDLTCNENRTPAHWVKETESGEMTPCPTCDGMGQTLYRGASHRDYDEPDYWDTCGICGGEGYLPASMFAAADEDENDSEDLTWSV